MKVWTARSRRRVETVTVCSACFTASCWRGEYRCDDYRGAGTVERTAEQLRALNREHPSYWEAS